MCFALPRHAPPSAPDRPRGPRPHGPPCGAAGPGGRPHRHGHVHIRPSGLDGGARGRRCGNRLLARPGAAPDRRGLRGGSGAARDRHNGLGGAAGGRGSGVGGRARRLWVQLRRGRTRVLPARRARGGPVCEGGRLRPVSRRAAPRGQERRPQRHGALAPAARGGGVSGGGARCGRDARRAHPRHPPRRLRRRARSGAAHPHGPLARGVCAGRARGAAWAAGAFAVRAARARPV